ncbi:MAG: N-acetyltransferase [Candidatus Aenigmatarchaeota archaeon]|nr:MAG: N-acetyltransferase [Candidatus Aenigmarchaeota archaeon]
MESNFFKHKTAVVETDEIGEGTKIWHFAHVREMVKIGKNCNIGKSCYIDESVEISDNVKIQNFVSVYKGVDIEENVFIGPSVTFTNDLNPRSFIWNEEKITRTTIKKGVSIGANSTIVCGIKIGEYALIGAGSVVTKNVPPFGLVYGNPAKLKGCVCYCGEKLSDIKEKRNNKIIYICKKCGKEVEILSPDP